MLNNGVCHAVKFSKRLKNGQFKLTRRSLIKLRSEGVFTKTNVK